jgi:hypothetical protein
MDSVTLIAEQVTLIESLTKLGIIQTPAQKQVKPQVTTSAPKKKFKYPEPRLPDRVFVPWKGSTISATTPARTAEKTLCDYYCANCLSHVGNKKAEPEISVRLYSCKCDRRIPKQEPEKLTREQLLTLRRLYVLGVIQVDTDTLAEFNKL